MSGSVSSEEGELNAIVKEFLEFSNLHKTVATFEEECQRMGKPVQEQAGRSRRDERILKIKDNLLEHFDVGRRTEFFSEWETHVSSGLRETNLACQKLEFNIQLHFAVLPMRKIDHWSKDEVEEAMLHFRYYLESKASVLSDCSEFLPFFALPYVPRPNNHPTFKDIFQEHWMPKLRSCLEGFLFEVLKSNSDDVQEPRLIELYHRRDLDLQDARKELQYLERHIEESEKRSVLHAKKCEKLQEECRQLMAVASLLVTALENAVKGNLVDMDFVLSACTTHLPDLNKLRSESPSCLATSRLSADRRKQKNIKEERLNFENLKQDLRASDERKKALLFQALRWRLTKAGNWNKREEAILEFVDNDLFDLLSVSDEPAKILLSIRSSDPLLLESFTRFLNAFASFVLGRQYLTSNGKLLELLVEYLLTNEAKEEITLDMILGTLKKLSIRRTSQNYMVEGGVIEWLASAFHQRAPLSSYALFSSVALLFNLSLCSQGKRRCEPLKVELISGLDILLQQVDSKISPYVNGILYRVLSIPSVREYAIEKSLPNVLHKLMLRLEGEPKKQLETILELFVSDVQIEDGSSAEEDDDQENDNLEPELESDEKIELDEFETSGESLLELYYDVKNVKPKSKSPMHSLRTSDSLALVNQIACEVKSAGSELSFEQNSETPVTPKLDVEATQLVRKIVGFQSTALVEAVDPVLTNIKGLNGNEYTVAFSSRPKIPRTPEPCEIHSPKRSPVRYRQMIISPSHTQGIYCNN